MSVEVAGLGVVGRGLRLPVGAARETRGILLAKYCDIRIKYIIVEKAVQPRMNRYISELR